MLQQIYLITIFLSALNALYHYNRLPQYLKGFAWLLVATATVEWTGYYTKNNLWMFNLFAIASFIFYFLLYRNLLSSQKQKKLLTFFTVSSTLLYAADMLFLQGINIFNTYSFTYSCILLTITALLFYHQLLNDNNPEPLVRVPMFWISTGILIFFPCNIFFMSLVNYIMHVSMNLAKQLFMIIHILNILMYSFFSIGIICSTTSQKSLS